ncbi:D-ribose pyranase [Ornithinimicrobium tianjinense]|uniref:D-ribose pyranase n=1 Tax=Ornithinimicrobium tianjinense TaxID=1195761 RepID=A0A917F428_9MICO|nr:D-ribose pyranase [Ornithinimicrobium tianjinense]GGF40563.1 D-ribose pyranase [Ornithinimicrobium tianjinense]
MKRQGILNVDLAARCARLGHTDLVCVADCGLPVPADVPIVDLAVVQGLPSFADVLTALLDELVVEHHVVAEEIDGQPAAAVLRAAAERLGPREVVSHQQLKALVADCAFVVRTGEATPYANVLLRSGVPF